MSNQNDLYIKGFNNGYLLSKHEPDLTGKLTQTLQPTGEYLEGFFSGKEEYEIEIRQIKLQELQSLRNKDRDREHEQERGQ